MKRPACIYQLIAAIPVFRYCVGLVDHAFTDIAGYFLMADCTHLLQQRIETSAQNSFFAQERRSVSLSLMLTDRLSKVGYIGLIFVDLRLKFDGIYYTMTCFCSTSAGEFISQQDSAPVCYSCTYQVHTRCGHTWFRRPEQMRPKRLGELSVREEADPCISCSAETSLERVDGGRINDTLIKAVPSVNNTLHERRESPAAADKPARRLRKLCTVYVRAVGCKLYS